jgi:RNA polymerase primary sigma factor
VKISHPLSIDEREELLRCLNVLSFREKEIIKLRYGLGDGYIYTLEEVGRIFKVTRERIRHIEMKAMRKMRAVGNYRGKWAR